MTKLFTPSTTDLNDMIARAMAKCDASVKAARQERAEAAFAHNARVRRAEHDAYCNQMPRARGFST
jgi:hypothetical protein